MKKLLLLMVTILSLTMLIGCEDISSNHEITSEQADADFALMEMVLSQGIPEVVNAHFVFPRLLDFPYAKVLWQIEGDSIGTHYFPYTAPLSDQHIQLTATVQYHGFERSFDFEFRMLSQVTADVIPTIYISTPQQQEVTSKDVYIDGSIRATSVVNNEESTAFPETNMQIRGRGNSTWDMPKTPYRIRFDGQTSLLGLNPGRDYVLLAEYADKSLMRNYLTFQLGNMLEHLPYTASARFVEVYYNGRYDGVYLLTEQMRLDDQRLDFESNAGEVNTGYFLELDQRLPNSGLVRDRDWFWEGGVPYVIKSPNTSSTLYTTAQTQYIKNYIRSMEQALTHRSGYEAYMDVASFIDYFIVQEIVKNVDVGWGSVYFFKEKNDVIKMSPLWDFDLAIGNADYIDYSPYGWYGTQNHKNRWFRLMMEVPAIRQQFKTRYLEIYETIIPNWIDMVMPVAESLSEAANRNFERWDRLGKYDWPNPPGVENAQTHYEQAYYIYDFLQKRTTWLFQDISRSNF